MSRRFACHFFAFLLATAAINGAIAQSAMADSSSLSFSDRVGYQRAIEEVYWRHRSWPNESLGAKPSLDAVVSEVQIEKKVQDYLRDCQALEHYWHQTISATQLQAELERIARHTKQPGMLRELFEALHNDPLVIAECLARPALAKRMVTGLYNYDQRVHGSLRERAQTELAGLSSVDQMKQTGGTYSEVDLVRAGAEQFSERLSRSEREIKLGNAEWDETVNRLTNALSNAKVSNAQTIDLPTGKPGRLEEDATRYFATAVIEKSAGHLRIATVSWSKEPIELWLTKLEKQLPATITVPDAAYVVPEIATGDGCANDNWSPSSLNIPSPRSAHTAIWTGSEMIVWGGSIGYPSTPNGSGGRYNPSTDVWTTTNSVNAPTSRGAHTAVWTGTEMIIWGGAALNTGGRYNPATDRWTATSTASAPAGRSWHSAVWTGSQMVIWGGFDTSGCLNSGGRYDPATNTWKGTSATNAPAARAFHSVVWTGSEMIIWGGNGTPNGFQYLNTGSRYNPGANTWTAISTTNAPDARDDHSAVWTGSKMIVWGGTSSNVFNLNTGGIYDLASNSWTATNTSNAPDGRYAHTAVWTGNEMIVWGGETANGYTDTGSRYDPGTDTWTAATSTANAPPSRWHHSAVWTGNEMIVWGGEGTSGNGALNTGGRYNPGTDTWAPTQPPDARTDHTAVWTGTEMIIWGGFAGLGTGGRYDPATDTWTETSRASAPVGRYLHAAVWTGNEMIVWGGFDGNCSTNTGGKYNPATDTWIDTSLVNAPPGRSFVTSVWTGGEMIVWGGRDCDGQLQGNGGRYNPSTDTWLPTSNSNAPLARFRHTAVWTGSEMIIWGGTPDDFTFLNTGSRYNPNLDSWTATGLTNAPSARILHTTLWTDAEMIVWGGEDSSNNYLGTGAKYDPATDTWATTSSTSAPSIRGGHTAIWTGNEMIVWGGGDNSAFYLNTGAKYDPANDSWNSTSMSSNLPLARFGHTAVWTGDQMIVWGGQSPVGYLNNGGVYCGDAAPTPAPTPVVTVSVSPTKVTEGGTATFTISATPNTARPVTVTFAMTGKAAMGSDYTLNSSSNSITIPIGADSSTVTMTTVTDHVKEKKETAVMTLQPSQAYTFPSSGTKKKKPKAPSATVSLVDAP